MSKVSDEPLATSGKSASATEARCGRLLTEADLFDITKYLFSVNCDILQKLGIALGINHYRLQNTQATEMVSLWLQRVDQVDKYGGPTWIALEKAMRHDTVGMIGKANDVKKERLEEISMGIPYEDTMHSFLMKNGLSDPKWVSRFQQQQIEHPDQVLPIEGNEEIYKALSSGASCQEQAALKGLLKITEYTQNPGEGVNRELDKFGLESMYWSNVLAKQLGVTSVRALEYVGGESYSTLKPFVRKPWEKKALRKILKMEDEGSVYQRQREKHRKKLERRQSESMKMLQDLKGLWKKGMKRQDQEVQQMENDIRENLQISPESWLCSHVTLEDVISQLEACHDRVNDILKRRELSDISVVQNASGCLALRGILLTKNLDDQLQVRNILLKVPGDICLMRPSHSQYNKIKQFTSKQQENEFTRTIDTLGYSVIAFDKVGFWGITFEASSGYRQSREVQTGKHNQHEMYSSTVQYTIMPLASCYISDSELQLSDEAIKHLQEIEKLLHSNRASLPAKSEEFFKRFGSHINQGPLHFGGKYKLVSYSYNFQQSDIAAIQKLQSEAINIQASEMVAASTEVSTSRFQGRFQGKYSDTLMCQTYLEVTKAGGPPESSGIPEWKTGLTACNSTWNLIDRGTTLVPVWDVIKMNHTKDFQQTELLARELSHAWETMNQYNPEQAEQKSDTDVEKIMENVKIWNESQDLSHCEDHLDFLVKTKQSLAKRSMDVQAWPSHYLSQPPIQHFLKSVVDSCIQQSSPVQKATEHNIKLYMRQLVEPIDHAAVLKFPKMEYIYKWLYAMERSVIPMDCQDFLSLQKYFEYALDYMYSDMTRSDEKLMELATHPEISIKATATVAKAVSSLRYHLHKAGQTYEDNFIITILFPFKYDPDKYIFLNLFSACDLEYLCREFEEESKIFFSVKRQASEVKLQAHLFLLAIRMHEKIDVADSSLIRANLKYIEEKIGDKIDPQLKSILNEHHSNSCDFELFQSQLESAVSGISLVQGEGGQPLEDFLASVPGKKGILGESDSDKGPSKMLKKNRQCEEFFSMLGLTRFYPQQLTLRHALEIREDTLQSKTDSQGRKQRTDPRKDKKGAHKQIPYADPKLYPFVILQKIMAFDYKSREKLVCTFINKLSSAHKDTAADEMLDEDSDSDIGEDDETMIVHPMDGLLALLLCCDNFLRQDLMSRLATCQLAIPLLLPDPFTHQLIFPLWAMRSVVKEWKSTLKSSRTNLQEGPLVSYRAPLVSFLRFGTHSVSKSHLLNMIITDSRHDSFFHYNCEGGSAKRLLMNGLVEMCWYLPSDNVFPDVVNFANLHGDAREFSRQIKFLSKVSFMIFVLLNEEDLDDRAVQVLKQVTTVPGGLFLLQTKSTGRKKTWHERLKLLKKTSTRNHISVIKLNRNEAEIKDELQQRINVAIDEKWLAAAEHYALEECSDYARQCEISVDEDDKDCIKGKELATGLKDIIDKFTSTHPDASIKQLLVLQGSDLWYKWTMKDKEQYRHIHRGHRAIEEYSAQQRKHMKVIRKKQYTNVQNLTPLMKTFIMSLLTYRGNVRNYFLQWLKLILDNLSREQLPLLNNQFRQKRKELLEKKVNDIAEKACKEEMDELNQKIALASFGLEHLLREIGQIYEAVACECEPNKMKTQIFRLPNMAAELLMEGYPLELMDGDAAHVPMTWVSAVLDKVQEKLGNPRLLVLSILGLQSTGKSTLMNTIFGLRFSVSAGRCTRGAFMQLLPIHPRLKQECKCDYFLIVDTEGLRAPELDTLQTQKHDNELATFVIGLANLTVINIYGEIAGDLGDILQTAVHAFLRMKEVRLTPSCHFVHQNVSALMAGEKGMMGRFKFEEKLDHMTQAAAKVEKLEGQYKRFSQVIEFSDDHDVSHFPCLWKGDPPMAPVNPGYSMKAQIMKSHLIDFAKQRSMKPTHLSVFKERIKELWKAILHENFVFSFKNTLEIAAYNTLDAEYGQWSWSFQEVMMKWEQKAQNELRSCHGAELSRVYAKLTGELPNHMMEFHQGLIKKMHKYFEEGPEQELLAKWKRETEIRLNNLHRELQTHAQSHCRLLATSRQALAKVDEMKVNHRRKIVERVKELVSQLQKGRLDDEQLEQKFYEQWIEWMTELRSVQVYHAPVNVHNEVEKSLTDIFNCQHKTMIEILQNKPLQEWGHPLKLKVESVSHMKALSAFGRITTAIGLKWSEESIHQAQQVTNNVLGQVKKYLDSKHNENFNPSFTNELLRMIFKAIAKFQSKTFDFTSEYKMDMALTACGYALRKFDIMVTAFKKRNDPVEYLDREMRPHLFKLFKDQYFQVVQEKTAAETLCDLLSKSIKKQVISSLSTRIVDGMRSTNPSLQSKPVLKAKILLDIGEKLNQQTGSFDHCALYLKDIKQSLQWWIKHYTNQYCMEGEPSVIVRFAREESSVLISCIKHTAYEVTQELLPEQEQFDINDWLTKLYEKLQGKLEIDVAELHDLGGIQQLQDVRFFYTEVRKGLEKLESTLQKECMTMNISTMDQWQRKPYDIIFENLAGCTEQCPFCQEQCDLTNKSHIPSTKHSVAMHRPECLGGYRWIKTGVMAVDLCSSLVGSDNTFQNTATNNLRHPYKEYHKIYPQWSIPDDKSVEASSYWKWLVGHYTREVAQLFDMKEAQISSEWKQLTWNDVKKDLENMYHI